MSTRRDAPASDEGRIRPGRPWALVAIVVAAILAVAAASLFGRGGTTSSGDTAFDPPAGGVEEAGLHGRLVYAAAAARAGAGERQRLVIYHLDRRAIELGPPIPAALDLVAVEGDVVAIVEEGDGEEVAYRVDPFDDRARPRLVGRGDLVETSSFLDALLLVDARVPRGCSGGGYEARLVPLSEGTEAPTAAIRGCGTVASGVPTSAGLALTVLEGDRARVLVREPPARPRAVLRDLAVVGWGPTGTFLFVDAPPGAERSTPPTGPLVVWPGVGGTRAAAEGLVAKRVLGWAPGGSRVVVNGSLIGQRAMWLVFPAAGTATILLPSERLSAGAGSSGAAFDNVGTVFGASAGVIVAQTSSGTFPLALPRDAPPPVGPIVWMP